MKVLGLKNWELGIIIILTLVASGYTLVAKSQVAPQFLISWKANTYTPSDYQGKILPSPGSTVTISIELVDNNLIANLSRHEIVWLINNRLIASGNNLKTINYRVPPDETQNLNVEIIVNNYKNQTLTATAIIPVVKPKIVINIPYPDKILPTGVATLAARPYFFNIADIKYLAFKWTANGVQTSGEVSNPDVLQLEIPPDLSGQIINLNVAVQNLKNILETALQTTVLFVQ